MWFRSVTFWTAAAVAAVATTTAVVADKTSRRDFALIQDALNNLNSLLQQLDESILALNEENIATAGPALLQLADFIRPSLVDSVAQIKESEPLSLQDTLNLNTARRALNQNINLTVSDLSKQKPLFDAANLSPKVADELQTVRDMSGNFFDVIQSKLDPEAPSELGRLNATLVVFDSTVATFRDQATTSTGILDSEGACICMVVCPNGSLTMSSVV